MTNTRQQVHQRIAQALADRFPETVETQPELLAHHYTEAGLIEQALPYWHRAGDHAAQHSANQEAIEHFNKALELLTTLPDTPEHARHELTLYVALAERLEVTKSPADPEVERAYTRAHELCRQTGDNSRLNQVLIGLFSVYFFRAALPQAIGTRHLLGQRQRFPTPCQGLIRIAQMPQGYRRSDAATRSSIMEQWVIVLLLGMQPQVIDRYPLTKSCVSRRNLAGLEQGKSHESGD